MPETLAVLLIADTEKSFEVACAALQKAVLSHHFGLMGVHDLGETLRRAC
jgi:uncharacterized protein (DUF302 family)